jgi:hypothetical protein
MRTWVIAPIACLLLAFGCVAVAQAAGEDAGLCPVSVFAVLPMPGFAANSTYAAFLSTPENAGRASGTMWINTRDGAFHVPFSKRITAAPPFAGSLDPIVFTLPKPAPLENIFVESLDDPEPGPCAITSTWVPGITEHLRAELKRRFAQTLPRAEPPVTAARISDPDTACHSGNARARSLILARGYDDHTGGGSVYVHVQLAVVRSPQPGS